MTKLEREVLKSKETMAKFKGKVKAAENCAEDAAYERDNLQARLQQATRGHDEVDGNITCVQGTIDCFSAGLKKDQEYM